MRVYAILIPSFAILAGASGLYLRIMELKKVFDESTGLPLRGAGITFALIMLTVAVVLIAIAFAVHVRLKYTSPRGFESAFGTEILAYPLVFFIIGVLWLGSTVKYFIDLNTGETIPLSDLFFTILSALAAISATLFAIEGYQDPRRKTRFALSIIPTLFMCYWLVLFYRQNASNPILLSYCYECLAIITSALGFYFTSGFIYNRPAPGKATFSFLTAIYFCFITLADEHAISIKLIYIAMIAINVAYSFMLIRNMRRKI